MAHSYDRLFYDYLKEGSIRSARAVLPAVVGALHPRSVLDVGCGAGAWLLVYREMGVATSIGVDGAYVDRDALLIDPSRFLPRDVGRPFDLGRQFDLVQCLEVAEHVPEDASRALVDNIVRHGKRVLFSAAVPGQGGEDHVNEQPYAYWRDLFAARGYRLFDFLRPLIAGNDVIEPWYRYNSLFFAHDEVVESLPASIKSTRVADDDMIRDFSPSAYRLRKAAMRALPRALVSWLAVTKHRFIVRAKV